MPRMIEVRGLAVPRLLVLTCLLGLLWGAAAFGQDAAPVKGVLTSIGEGEDMIHVLKVWGTPYEMGYAQGSCARRRSAGFTCA